jgi:hypothetical protein
MTDEKQAAVEALAEVRSRIDQKRRELAALYERRTEITAEALGVMTRTEIAEALGVVRPAVNKILAGLHVSHHQSRRQDHGTHTQPRI